MLFSHPTQTRRREPPIAGVPAAVYNVSREIGSELHHTVPMQTMTTREAHWYGKNGLPGNSVSGQANTSYGVFGGDGPMSGEEMDRALAITRPHVKAATLPPRTKLNNNNSNNSSNNKYPNENNKRTCVSV